MQENICLHCSFAVGKDEQSFCLSRDLFTHTEEEQCDNYDEGKPFTYDEWEKY